VLHVLGPVRRRARVEAAPPIGPAPINPHCGPADGNAVHTKPCVYPLQLLEDPRLSAAGIEHGPDRCRQLLRWRDVIGALAAEVGEPEGVRTIVFDLLTQTRGGRVAVRLDAEPGEPASAVAQTVAAALGDRARPSIKELAADGVATLWFPDLASFEEIASAELAGS